MLRERDIHQITAFVNCGTIVGMNPTEVKCLFNSTSITKTVSTIQSGIHTSQHATKSNKFESTQLVISVLYLCLNLSIFSFSSLDTWSQSNPRMRCKRLLDSAGEPSLVDPLFRPQAECSGSDYTRVQGSRVATHNTHTTCIIRCQWYTCDPL